MNVSHVVQKQSNASISHVVPHQKHTSSGSEMIAMETRFMVEAFEKPEWKIKKQNNQSCSLTSLVGSRALLAKRHYNCYQLSQHPQRIKRSCSDWWRLSLFIRGDPLTLPSSRSMGLVCRMCAREK